VAYLFFFKILISAISGGAIWEGFKFFSPELKRIFTTPITAKNSFYKNLDPILKASSELYGKLESLAKEDFSSFINPSNSNSENPEHNRKYVYYLFAQFWAQLEYLRLESQFTSLSKITKGQHLLRFIETIESRKFRILDRSIQRIIGECLIINKDQKFKVMTLNEFMQEIEKPETPLTKWINALEVSMLNVSNKVHRQRILRFGVIVAALIDQFDSKHKTVRRRDIYINKLSPRSRIIIEQDLIGHYLKFLDNKTMYYQKK